MRLFPRSSPGPGRKTRPLTRPARLALEPLEDRAVPAGTFDPTFSNDGKVLTDFLPTQNSFVNPRAVAVQADGKVLVAGSFNNVFAVFRYNANGTVDTGFGGGDGVATVDLGKATGPESQTSGPSSGEASGVAVLPDGKILVGGQRSTLYTDPMFGSFTYSDIVLVRLSPNGSPDGSFGNAGVVPHNYGTFDKAEGMAVQPDGKVLVVGSTLGDFSLFRYHGDGSPDSGFGNNGVATTDFGAESAFGRKVVLQPDGKAVVAGYFTSSTGAAPQSPSPGTTATESPTTPSAGAMASP